MNACVTTSLWHDICCIRAGGETGTQPSVKLAVQLVFGTCQGWNPDTKSLKRVIVPIAGSR